MSPDPVLAGQDHVLVLFDQDGTDTDEFRNAHVSAQMWSGGKALIKERDEQGRLVRSVIYRTAYRIERVKSYES
jgi:hypothetical protein